jgi:hypothetical protein
MNHVAAQLRALIANDRMLLRHFASQLVGEAALPEHDAVRRTVETKYAATLVRLRGRLLQLETLSPAAPRSTTASEVTSTPPAAQPVRSSLCHV